MEACNGDYFERLFLDYRATPALRISPVGACAAELLDAPELGELFETL